MRSVYAETQNWARHNEMLIVAANTILAGALGAVYASSFAGNAPQEPVHQVLFWGALFGLTVTLWLNHQYQLAVRRLVVYERYFLLHDPDDLMPTVLRHDDKRKSWGESFVPAYLHRVPAQIERGAGIFLMLHVAVAAFAAYKLWA